jgi:murein DD-endopeptidase MepM/ murein hydrolase activator NlpD
LQLRRTTATHGLVASPPEMGPRHVGRVVDELAREDGDVDELSITPPSESTPDTLEPALETTAAEVSAEDGVESPPADADAEPGTRATPSEPALAEASAGPHPVRERLLAKAAAARQTNTPAAPASSPASELDAIGRSAPARPVAVELDLGAQRGTRPPSAPLLGRGKRQLSPTLLAVFGTLLGLATIASLVALMLAVDPRQQHPVTAPIASSVPEPTPPAALEPKAQAPAKKRARQKLPGPWRIADSKNDPQLALLEGKVGLLPFLRAVEGAGLKTEQAYRVLTALKPHRNLDKTSKTDRFSALVERGSRRVKAFEYAAGEEEVYQVREGSDGLLVGKKLDLKVARGQIQGALLYDGGGFDAAAERAGFDPGLAKVMSKALDGHSGLEELERGDRVRVVVQEVTVLGDFARYAGVEAVEVVPADSGQKPFRIYYFQGTESRGYFDDRGRQPYEGGWRKPVKDAEMTSPFNPKRLHPILKKVMPHNGIDFGAPTGTPVLASSFGTVSYVGYAGASGNLVKVEHPGGVETGYAHLSRFAEGLKLGDHVKRLQLIGYVGSTGRSTGPHLHFSAQRGNDFFDPQSLNLDGMRTLTGAERGLFGQVKQNYDRLLDAIPLPDALPVEKPAPAGSVALDPAADEPDIQEPAAAAAPAAPAAPGPSPAAPAAPPPAALPTEPAAARAPAAPGNPIYLTDDELLKMQRANDDGEVTQ